MVKIKCDSCGFEDNLRPLRPLYSVDVLSTNVTMKNNSTVFLCDTPMERRNYCLCGKCLTKFFSHVARFFDSNMEDTQ